MALPRRQFISLLIVTFALVLVGMLFSNSCRSGREQAAVNNMLLAFAALMLTLQMCKAHLRAPPGEGFFQDSSTANPGASTSANPLASTIANTIVSTLAGTSAGTGAGTIAGTGASTLASTNDKPIDQKNASVAANIAAGIKVDTNPYKDPATNPFATGATSSVAPVTEKTPSTPPGTIPGTASTSSSSVMSDEKLPTSPMTAALSLYTSCFSKASYAGPEASGRTWKSIVSVKAADASATCTAGGSFRNMDLQFKSTPSFSKKDGFALGQNTLTGPLSYLLGINGDMAFSVMVLLQFTGEAPLTSAAASEASLFSIYANTRNNNGASLVIKAGDPVANMVSCQCILRIGNSLEVPCQLKGSDSILFQPRKPYLLCVVKNYGRVQVHCVDLGSSEYVRESILDHNAGTMEPIVFSNTDMTLNDAGNLAANILTFGVFGRALTDSDLSDWYKHYNTQLKQFDPAYVKIATTLQTAKAASGCTFDAPTCAACSSIKDWSNMSNLLGAGKECLLAIDKYCTANPTAARCECWNLNNPAYATTCLPLRGAFAGKTLVEESTVKKGQDKAACAAVTPQPHAALDPAALIKTLVTPENIVAVGKAISEIQGHHGHHGHRRSRDRGDHGTHSHSHNHRHDHHAKSCCCTVCRQKPGHAGTCPSASDGSSKIATIANKSMSNDDAILMADIKGSPPVNKKVNADVDAEVNAEVNAEVEVPKPPGFFSWLLGKK